MDILLDLLKDKGDLIKFLLKVIDDSKKESEGLMKLQQSLSREDPNTSIENISKCLATTMKISAKQSDTIQKLSLIALISCSSNSFDTDVAQVMNKLGRGKEALQQMFKNKMGK